MTAVNLAVTRVDSGPSTLERALRSFSARNIVAGVAALVLLVLVVCAAAPGWVAPYDPLTQSLRDITIAPGSYSSEGGYHLLGTDSLGRDVLSRLIYGARLSLGVGIGGVIVSSAIGIPLGLLAGYRGGIVDSVLMRVVDGLLSFPNLVLYIFLRYITGGGILGLILILSCLRWVAYVRVARSVTLAYRDVAFVEAARSIGCSERRIIFRQILPNVLAPLSVLATLEVAVLILAESSMSFLGLGVQPPAPSWGTMVAEGADYLAAAPTLIMFPGLTIFVAVLSLNIVARRARQYLAEETR